MSVTFISHAKDVLSAEQAARARALEIIGGKAESHAKKLCPVDTGRLRNSITHAQYSEDTEVVGSNVDYAPYVELGTHKQKAQPFLRPAAENHRAEYKAIIQNCMKNA